MKNVKIGIAFYLAWGWLMISACPLAKAQEREYSQTKDITLDECLKAVERDYPLGELKQIESDLAMRLKRALWYAYIPQLSLDGRITYQSDVVDLDIKMPKVMGIKVPPVELPEIPHWQYNAYIQATQLIWDGGRVKAGADLIEAKRFSSQAGRDIQLREVKDAVTELYFSLLLIDKQLELQDLLLEEINRQSARVASLLQSGLASENDLDLVQIELHRAEQDSTQLKLSRASITEALRIYTGLDFSSETKGILPAEAIQPEHNKLRLAPMRPEHLRLDAKRSVAEAEWKSYLASGMPTLSLFVRGGYGRPGLNMLNPDPATYYIAGASLSWNFGKLYDLSTQQKKLNVQREAIELQREIMERQVATELSNANSEIAQYRALLEQDKKAVELHSRVAERAKQQEEEGALSSTEYLQKISAYNSAQKLAEIHQIQLVRATYKAKNSLGQR